MVLEGIKLGSLFVGMLDLAAPCKSALQEQRKQPAGQQMTGLLKACGSPPAPSFEPATKAKSALAALKAARLPSTGNAMTLHPLLRWRLPEALSMAGASGNVAF